MQNSDPHRRAWKMGVASAMVLAVIGTGGASMLITTSFVMLYPELEPPSRTGLLGRGAALWLSTWLLSGLALKAGEKIRR